MASTTANCTRPRFDTKILPVDPTKLVEINLKGIADFVLEDWDLELRRDSVEARNLELCAKQLQISDVPVAFPTETVYGLGADATRSAAVKGIYQAKQRPSDNPLIVHFASLAQLRRILRAGKGGTGEDEEDVIPAIYKPLIQKFWPGPLTIIVPNPSDSLLAPEVSAGLSTFGARMPRNLLALALIKLSDRPIAAPSANASTKPSPTAAEHVLEDLDGRIQYILDGGPCDVGVESTVVDGLCDPPTILRPGGISIEQLRKCPGWENVAIGYKNKSETGSATPKAPGMKYRHYSPRATVVLYEAGARPPSAEEQREYGPKIGVIATKTWLPMAHLKLPNGTSMNTIESSKSTQANGTNGFATHARAEIMDKLHSIMYPSVPHAELVNSEDAGKGSELWQVRLGDKTADIARGLFSALRDLDRKGVDAIFVEGIDEEEGDVAAAVMNRLRKAAEVKVS
jgi:L-threonylcarbamoyladenylate synthase